MADPTSRKLLLINGPNLNLLGTREPGIYGSTTLPQIETALEKRAGELNLQLSTFQSNHEGDIVERIHAAREEQVAGITINPAGFTHTSVAIRDALLGVGIPFVELHVSNVHAREPWRKHSYFSDKAEALVAGLGAFGYVAVLEWWAWRFGGGAAQGL